MRKSVAQPSSGQAKDLTYSLGLYPPPHFTHSKDRWTKLLFYQNMICLAVLKAFYRIGTLDRALKLPPPPYVGLEGKTLLENSIREIEF